MIIDPAPLAWLELAIAVCLGGVLFVRFIKDPIIAWRFGVGFTLVILACAMTACVGYFVCAANGLGHGGVLQAILPRTSLLQIDELNAPLFPLIALIHFLTTLATSRTRVRHFSLEWSLSAEAIGLAVFGSGEPWLLIALLCLGSIPPIVELRNRGRSMRVFAIHALAFMLPMVTSWALVERNLAVDGSAGWPAIPLLLALLVRCGVIPSHCWIADWFENASFGNALLFLTPLTGVYAIVRLILPISPDWMLASIGIVSLITAIYAACMSVCQLEARRFFAYLFLSHASLVLAGLELHTPISLTGSLSLWASVSLSLTGFGLTIRALEARFGQLSLISFRGLYYQCPALAVCFLLSGLGSVGFPGTLGFVAAELLVDGAVQASPLVGLAMAATAAVNGIAVVRAYFLLFTGASHSSAVSLAISRRERFAVLVLVGTILGGGIFPQPGIESRYRAATTILRERDRIACLPAIRQSTSVSLAETEGSIRPTSMLATDHGDARTN